MAAELTGARISRGLLKGSVEKKIQISKKTLAKVQSIDTGQVSLEQTTEIQASLDKAKEALDKYTEAVVRCLALEGGEHNPEEEYVVFQGELEDDLDNLDYKVQAIKARVKEEKAARARAEATANGRTHDQPGNSGRVTAKPPPQLPKDISLEEFDTWTHTWGDYFAVTKLEKEPNSLQRANLMSHMSQEMRAVVEHILGIGDDSTKSCPDIIKEIRAHIRSSRNIQLDKVAFEKRTQRPGESFDDYLVTIRKLARNAGLCKECLEDRLLTKIMSGLVDQEVREELLARVPAPKLEEAITFARSKEAARRSNMDLGGRSVQQVRDRDCLKSRSESPKRYWREQPREKTPEVQVLGLICTKRAPMAQIDVRTLDGRDKIGNVKFYPDSAADCTIMGQHMLEQFRINPQELEPPDQEGVDAANKSPFKLVGRVKVTFDYHGRSVRDEIHVVEDETDLLVSWDTCIGLGILHENYPEPIDKEPPRARAISYRYRAEHIKGEHNIVAGAFSRAPVGMPTEEDILGEDASKQIRRTVRRAASCAGVDDELEEALVDPNMEWIKNAAREDNTYKELLETVRQGFSEDKNKVPESVRPYYALRMELSEWQGLVILKSRRIVIPLVLRKEVLKRLHANHQGVDRTQRRALETVYWPGITSDITSTVSSCNPCAERLQSNAKETMKTNIEKKIAELQEKSERYYNIGARDLPELSVGDRVRVQDRASKRWIEKGVIARKGQNRDYYVELVNGKMRWRNRRFLCLMSDSFGGEEDGDLCERDKDFTLRRSTRERKPRVRFNV